MNRGEDFPNFIVNTIENKNIELLNLKGKIVIIRFEIESNTFRFKKHEIMELDSKINQIENNESKIEAIIIFSSSQSEVKQGFDLKNSNFQLVANGRNFHQKFSITSFPTTLVLDTKGKLIDYYEDPENVDLPKLLLSYP